jgi:hypothetical protein
LVMTTGVVDTQTQAAKSTLGVWLFYVVFVGVLLGEDLIVGAILAATRAGGIPAAGPWLAWAAFVAGGMVLGLIELRTIQPAQRLRDPVLRACCWLQRRLGVAGYAVNAMLIGGAPGCAVALVQVQHPRRVLLTLAAAVLFASIWVPLFVLVWR